MTGALRNLLDEATSRVVDDAILAKPPPLWIPAFAGMTVVQRSPKAGTHPLVPAPWAP